MTVVKSFSIKQTVFVGKWYNSKMVCPINYDWRPAKGRKEENVLFNDALNTFYLRLYGVRHMVKDHSDSEK